MPVEQMIEEYNDLQEVIKNAITRQSEIINQIRNAGTEDFDWVSVRKASELLGVSQPLIYAKINSGELSVKHISSKKLVKKSELMKLDNIKK